MKNVVKKYIKLFVSFGKSSNFAPAIVTTGLIAVA